MRTRLAPTPSGYLHDGNAVNLLLIDRMARERSGTVTLRIDDMDAPRYRPEYVDDLFAVLDWLEIAWDEGPRSRADVDRRLRMPDRLDTYRQRLLTLQAGGLITYACVCSRSQAVAAGVRGCIGGCRGAAREYRHGETAVRAVVPVDLSVRVGERLLPLHAEFGDPVLWRRDDLPAYHLASLDEDVRGAMTDIVRGRDLAASSALQAWLASHSTDAGLADVTFWHHDLVTDDAGTKLSKSQLGAQPLVRTPAHRERLLALAADLGTTMTADHVRW